MRHGVSDDQAHAAAGDGVAQQTGAHHVPVVGAVVIDQIAHLAGEQGITLEADT